MQGPGSSKANAEHIGLSYMQGHDPRWALAVKICILVVALVSTTISTFFGSPTTAERVRFLFPAIATLFGLMVLNGLWLRLKPRPNVFHFFQFFCDSLLVTMIVYVTGNARSPFVFLYLPIVIVSTILISSGAALALGLLSTAAYLSLMCALLTGYINAADGSPVSSLSYEEVMSQGASLLSTMLLLTLSTRYLVRRLNQSYITGRRAADEAELRGNARLDEIPHGIIVVSECGTIEAINEKARIFFRIESAKSVGSLDRLKDYIVQKVPEFRTWPSADDIPVEVGFNDEFGTHHLLISAYNSASSNGQVETTYIIEDITTLRMAEAQLEIQDRLARLKNENNSPELIFTSSDTFLGESHVMQKVFDLISRVAASDATVLITGESGTGKELAARSIHQKSPRANGPFVAVNCSAIPETLIESELFGHKKGSFTGAVADSRGLFREADGGTIFLDEIGELPLSLQVKLLRVIQERTIRGVGETHDVKINVRIIAATNRNLRSEIAAGHFREDLFYRLNVIAIHLPPLRERKQDIPILVHGIIKKLCGEKNLPLVPPATMELLTSYPFPGNVRELENILERAYVLNRSAILPENMPELYKSQEETVFHPVSITVAEDLKLPVNLDSLIDSLEQAYLEVALLQGKGNRKQVASLLGINLRSLRYRLKKHGLLTEQHDGETKEPKPLNSHNKQ